MCYSESSKLQTCILGFLKKVCRTLKLIRICSEIFPACISKHCKQIILLKVLHKNRNRYWIDPCKSSSMQLSGITSEVLPRICSVDSFWCYIKTSLKKICKTFSKLLWINKKYFNYTLTQECQMCSLSNRQTNFTWFKEIKIKSVTFGLLLEGWFPICWRNLG